MRDNSNGTVVMAKENMFVKDLPTRENGRTINVKGMVCKNGATVNTTKVIGLLAASMDRAYSSSRMEATTRASSVEIKYTVRESTAGITHAPMKGPGNTTACADRV